MWQKTLGFWPHLHAQIFPYFLALLFGKLAKTPAIAEATLVTLSKNENSSCIQVKVDIE